MDQRVALCLVIFIILAAWVWIEILISMLEIRLGIPGVNIAGACFVFLLAVSSNTMPALPYQVAALIIGVCFAYQVFYYLQIRKNHHPYLSRRQS